MNEKSSPTKQKKRSGVVAAWLWWLYGYTYDGLLNFHPYVELVNKIFTLAKLENGQRILDLGCGTGNFLYATGNLNVQRVGVDASSSMLKIAHRKFKKNKTEGDTELNQSNILDFLSRQDGQTFDRIISINVFYTLPEHARKKIWREVLRVLAQDGVLVVANPVTTNSKGLIREQLKHKGLLKSLRPRLIGVLIVDSLINILGNTRQFEFPSEALLREEIATANGHIASTQVAYGEVDVIFTITHV